MDACRDRQCGAAAFTLIRFSFRRGPRRLSSRRGVGRRRGNRRSRSPTHDNGCGRPNSSCGSRRGSVRPEHRRQDRGRAPRSRPYRSTSAGCQDHEPMIHSKDKVACSAFDRVVAAIRIARVVGLAHAADQMPQAAAIGNRRRKGQKTYVAPRDKGVRQAVGLKRLPVLGQRRVARSAEQHPDRSCDRRRAVAFQSGNSGAGRRPP